MSEVKLTYSKLVQIARGLALGALEGKWKSTNLKGSVEVDQYVANEIGIEYVAYDNEDRSIKELYHATQDEIRRILRILSQLSFLDYTPPVANQSIVFSYADYSLSNKSFQLLNQSGNVSVFISYRRKTSALLALYLEAKFSAVGSKAFIDINNIKKAEEWELIIRNRIQQCNYFLCILAPETLESNNVVNEIRWAYEAKVAMVPIMHDGFQIPDTNHDYINQLFRHDGFRIHDMSDSYELHSKVNALLIELGYAITDQLS